MKILDVINIISILLLAVICNYTPKNYKNFSDLNKINKKLMIIKFVSIILAIIICTSKYIILFIKTMTIETFIMMLFFISTTLVIIFIMFVINRIKTKKAINKFKGNINYIRDIPKDISITTATYLANKKISFEKSIKLTILELYCKKYINIIIENDNIKIIKENNVNTSKIKKSEKYILDYLFSDNKENFNIDDWYNIIKEELIEENVAEESNDYKLTTQYFIIYSILFLPFAIYYLTCAFSLDSKSIFSKYFVLGFTYSLIPLIFFYIYESKNRFAKLRITNKGYYFKAHLNLLKEYLKQFTSMNKTKIKEVYLWEEYLVYANALNVSYNHNELDDIKMKLLSDAKLKEYIESFIYIITSKNDDFY